MKRVLIVVPSFNSGGTISSLINVSSSIDKNQFDVYVYAITNYGSNKEIVHKYCKFIGERGITSSKHGFKRKVFFFAKRVFKVLRRLGIDLSQEYYSRIIEEIKTYSFDYIIAFQEGVVSRFVSMIPFSKKIAWVRSEYSRYLELTNHPDESSIYNSFDKIVCVSKAATKNFLNCFPQYSDKTYHLYNLINADRVLALSNESVNYLIDSDVFNIISLGRIDPVKRYDKIPAIAEYLISKGCRIRWIIVGGYSEQNEPVFRSIK